MKPKQYYSLKQQAFDKFFETLLVSLAVHDLKLKQQPKVRPNEPDIQFVEWVRQ
jgi:hypothetical protein